jgi:uncharacterized protein
MPPRRFHLHDGQHGSALAIRVVPRASRNEISALMEDGSVKVRLTAAPVDGEANDQLVAFLAKSLDVPKAKIEIVAGWTGRNKLVSVLGLDAETLQQRLAALLK